MLAFRQAKKKSIMLSGKKAGQMAGKLALRQATPQQDTGRGGAWGGRAARRESR